MKLKDLLETTDKGKVALSKKLKISVDEIKVDKHDKNRYIIGSKHGDPEYFVYNAKEATKHAINSNIEMLDDSGVFNVINGKFKKQILSLEYVKSNKKSEAKQWFDFYDEDSEYSEQQLNPLMDLEKIAHKFVLVDGVESALSTYDGKKINLGGGLFAFRIQ